MSRLPLLIVVGFALLAVSTVLPPSASVVREAEEAKFAPDEIAVGFQRSWESRLLMWGSQAAHLALLLALVFTSWGRTLVDAFDRRTGGRWFWTLLLTGAAFFVLDSAVAFPWQVGRWVWNRGWGLSNQTFAAWLRDYAVSQAVYVVLEGIVFFCWYGLMRRMPRAWWLVGAGLATAFGVATAFLHPLLVAPLFNTFVPLRETSWASREPEIRKLLAKAEVPIDDLLVADASKQSDHSNAYFTGFGSSRRIVLFDTLLKDHPADEIEVILAHELGHWLHDHIVKGLLLGGIASAVGLYLLRRLLIAVQGKGRLALRSQHDPASLFIVMLAVWIGSWLASPVENGISRHFERQADWTSLELARDPEAFVRAERRLALRNKANLTPTRWNVWLFASHPPVVERMRLADEWRRLKR